MHHPNHYVEIPIGMFTSKRDIIIKYKDKHVLAEVRSGSKSCFWPAVLRYDSETPDVFFLESIKTGGRTEHEVKSLLGLLVAIG